MTIDFGVPPSAPEIRALVELRLKERNGSDEVPETLRVEWRDGQAINVEVIDMPVERLFYNPGTHRVRAQRSFDPDRDKRLEADPWSPESQDYLHYLLQAKPSEPDKRDPDFDALQESLRLFKQNEPGLITRDGILVNGNTRRAALKELGKSSVRVGVLPASCTWEEINQVELSLQLRPDKRRPYSFINQLITMDEQVRLSRGLNEIASEFHTTVAVLERNVWILAQLRELIERSGGDGFTLRLMDLERSQEKLAEVYRAYQKEAVRSKERADLLKEARLAAIVLEFAKTDVRFIGADFQERYLDALLPADMRPTAAAMPGAVSIPGLNRSVQPSGGKVAAARALTDRLLKAKAIQAAGDKATPAQLQGASAAVEALHEAFNEAITNAGRDERLKKKRQAAPDRVIDASKDLEQCITDLVLARGNGSLDEAAFDDALQHLHSVIGNLAAEAQRTILLGDKGLEWLVAAAAADGGQA